MWTQSIKQPSYTPGHIPRCERLSRWTIHRFLTSSSPPVMLPLANILKPDRKVRLENYEIIWSHPPPRNTHTITQSDRNCISKHAHKHTSLNHKLTLLQSEEQGVIKTRRVVIRNDWKEGMKEWWNVTDQLESVYDPHEQGVRSEVNLICVKHF